MPENVTPERKRILRAYGAELVLTDPLEGSDGAIREVRRVYAEDPARYFYPDQYSNPANWKAHYDGTGPEILAQTDGSITHFVAGLGTSGTFVGAGRFLRDHKPGVTLVSVQPDAALHGLEGLKHMDSAIVPAIYDSSLADIDLGVGTEESYLLTKRLALEEGLLVGISSGAALAAVAAHRQHDHRRCHRDDLFRWRREVFVGTLLGGASGRVIRWRGELTCRRAFSSRRVSPTPSAHTASKPIHTSAAARWWVVRAK